MITKSIYHYVFPRKEPWFKLLRFDHCGNVLERLQISKYTCFIHHTQNNRNNNFGVLFKTLSKCIRIHAEHAHLSVNVTISNSFIRSKHLQHYTKYSFFHSINCVVVIIINLMFLFNWGRALSWFSKPAENERPPVQPAAVTPGQLRCVSPCSSHPAGCFSLVC